MGRGRSHYRASALRASTTESMISDELEAELINLEGLLDHCFRQCDVAKRMRLEVLVDRAGVDRVLEEAKEFWSRARDAPVNPSPAG